MARASGSGWRRVRLVVALMLLSAALLLVPARVTSPARVLFQEAVGPLQTALYQGAGQALSATGTLSEMFRARDRERALEGEVERLRNRGALLEDELRRRRQELASIQALELKEAALSVVSAPVAAYDTAQERRSISVRAGSSDGVGPGMAVTADGALVGIVQEAGPFQCRVRLITDPRSVIPCRVSPTRDLCVLVGTGERTCRAEWLDRDAFIEAGNVLVTASLQAAGQTNLRLPDGLPLATVSAVEPDPMHPLFYGVTATPRANLDRLERVEVLVPRGS